jgi:hypothetical protein
VIEKINKTVYRCTCEHKDCIGKGKSWISDDPDPERCRWCGRRTWNGQDLRHKRLVTANGKTQRISEWAKETGIEVRTIRARLRLRWTEDDAVNTPTRERKVTHANS